MPSPYPNQYPAQPIKKAGKVYLLGAGPGSSDYLTLAGQRLLSQADALVYDALIDVALLQQLSPTCEHYHVGKRGGQPSTPQAQINQLLVKLCKSGKQIVRLKAGDPFIFGRAAAEIQALQAENCLFEVIPGLSSALVAPLLVGVPLTDPVLSRGFGVFTAHDLDALDWQALARLDTLVMLMGGRRLRVHSRQHLQTILLTKRRGRLLASYCKMDLRAPLGIF